MKNVKLFSIYENNYFKVQLSVKNGLQYFLSIT